MGFIPLMVRPPIESLFSGEIDVAEPYDGTTTVAGYPATTLERGGMQHHRSFAIPDTLADVWHPDRMNVQHGPATTDAIGAAARSNPTTTNRARKDDP